MRQGDPDAALAALDHDAIAADLSALVRAVSPTGDERPAFDALAAILGRLGIEAELTVHDLAGVRAAPGYPGEEAPRSELLGLRARLPNGGRRLCLAGHVDVVGVGTVPWRHEPFGGTVADGFVHGRGSVDMKAGVVAAVHALAALQAAPGAPDVTLLAVASEEDGGLGAFAALEEDADYAACIVPEPTDFDVVCAHGGALTLRGRVEGVAAHAAFRLAGRSAIDAYVPIHAALADYERRINRDVAHPLLAALELPYPVLVGQVHAGAWSSSVPDRLEFEARIGVPVGESPASTRSIVEALIADAAPEGVRLEWTGGQFGAGATDPDDPLVTIVREATRAEVPGGGALAGVPYGADMRLFTDRGIPTVMVGPRGTRLAHAVDERVAIDDVVATARILVRAALAFA